MRKNFLITAALSLLLAAPVSAQRFQDKLDRGLVAVKVTNGVYCSWRVLGEEYYNVAYNIYRDGTKLNSTPLTVSNYSDTSGSATSKYTVRAVVNGVEQADSKAATVITTGGTGYGYIELQKPKRISVGDNTTDITDNFTPWDATCGDVDGDGEMEIIIKQVGKDNNGGYTGPDFDRFEIYKLDGTLLWWLDCGANLADFQHSENNVAVYDWDEDGKAEFLMRAADGTTVHAADGKTYVIGDPTKIYRANAVGSQWFVHEGAEYLIYLNGETGVPYEIGPSDHPTYMEYPLKRLEDGETDLNKAWGDGYGHRSTKHFYGAPYFDGRNPSIFLARGIYTRHKMIAYDVDKTTHKLTERWRWFNNTSGAWYGQGYHNYAVADVDCDGRDEIVYGSMVIDDNGHGLSTSGLGHGDAEHVGDYNPYVHGLEIYACNESHPSNNYRDATTSKIYYRLAGGSDDGRSMMGNFTNRYPGAVGASGHDTPISSVANSHISGYTTKPSLNFRIYWDGDLLDESLNGTATRNSEITIWNSDTNSSWTLGGSLTNNDSKATPCLQADLFGDWREEVVARTEDGKIRIYTSTVPTNYRMATLLSDKQYRNAMVWQMDGYSQPPAVSYFVGQLEGITAAPPAETNRGRDEVANGGTIGTSLNGKQVLMAETNDMTVSVSDGAAPEVFFDNAPTWVQGHDNNDNITTTTYTHTLTGGAFGGTMRLVKQGDGVLVLPNVEQKYTGSTDVWAGTLNFDGTLNGPLWLNRLTTLNTNGGNFKRGIKADYGANIIIGGGDAKSTLTTDTLALGFGAIVNFKIFADGTNDQVKANVITLEKKNWSYGPTYNAPVINITAVGGTATAGTYILADNVTLTGNLSSVTISGLSGTKAELVYENKQLKLVVYGMRDPADMTWMGSTDGTWDFADKTNFAGADGLADVFVTGDNVVFNDSAAVTTVNISGNVAPKSITFDNNNKTYTITGDSIVGEPTLTKNGTGEAMIYNLNRMGNTTINGGKLTVSSLANSVGQDFGSLGDVSKQITITNGATLKLSNAATVNQRINISGEGTIENTAGMTMSRGIMGGGTLTKRGGGTLSLAAGNSLRKLVIGSGTVSSANGSLPATVEFGNGSTLEDNTSNYSTLTSSFVVPENVKATLTMAPYAAYGGKLTGKGQLTVTATGVRCSLTGDWSAFEGTIVAGMGQRGSYAAGSLPINNDYGLPLATLNVPANVTVSNEYRGSSHNVEVGSYTGSGTLAGSGRWIVGANNDNITFGLNSTSTLVKRGTGTMRIISVGKLDCNLYVSDGYLVWSNTSTRLLGTHGLTVEGSGKVVANGLVQSITMTGNSQLTPTTSIYSLDNPTSKGTFTTTSIFAASGNATVNFVLAKNGQSSTLQVGTDLSLSRINVLLGNYTPTAGDEFTLWTCKTMRQAPTTILLPDLPEGLAWDTTALTDGSTTGVLKVVSSSTGINGVTIGAGAHDHIYTIDGKKVNDTTKPGIYIVNGKKVIVK